MQISNGDTLAYSDFLLLQARSPKTATRGPRGLRHNFPIGPLPVFAVLTGAGLKTSATCV